MPDVSQQLIEQVKAAGADGKKLNICGLGSKQFMGRDASGETLSVCRHSGIVSYQPVELVVTVRAGTALSEIESALEEQGQMLSFEPPSFGSGSSIGGTLAANQSGPSRPWSGSVRDMVLGTQLINGSGEHLRFGGQVMKNVAGYDVSRLQAGAMGTLGVITEISFKVLPRPAASITLIHDMAAEEAIHTMNRLSGQAKPLSAACWIAGKLYLRLSGAQAAVEGTAEQWGGQVMEEPGIFWRRLRDHQLDYFSGCEPLWRFSLKPSAEHLKPDANWLLDWGGAQRWLRGDFEKFELEQLAGDAKGQVGLFRGGARNGEVFHSQPKAMQAIHRRVKDALDPQGLFNPGRLYSWM